MPDAAKLEPLTGGESFASFVAFLEEVTVDGVILQPDRYCRALNIDLSSLAEQSRVHPKTSVARRAHAACRRTSARC